MDFARVPKGARAFLFEYRMDKTGAKKTPPNAGKGRVTGVPNKITRELKQMILDALDGAGGVKYLTTQAKKNPKAFLTLLGKVMPLQVTGAGEGGEHLVDQTITIKLVKSDAG